MKECLEFLHFSFLSLCTFCSRLVLMCNIDDVSFIAYTIHFIMLYTVITRLNSLEWKSLVGRPRMYSGALSSLNWDNVRIIIRCARYQTVIKTPCECICHEDTLRVSRRQVALSSGQEAFYQITKKSACEWSQFLDVLIYKCHNVYCARNSSSHFNCCKQMTEKAGRQLAGSLMSCLCSGLQRRTPNKFFSIFIELCGTIILVVDCQ